LLANPTDRSDVYNLTKMTGEALCFASGREAVRVVRLSNVYGPGMSPSFLLSLITDALEHGRIVLRSSLASAKDYISVSDVVRILPEIALSGRHRLYNVGKGQNTTNRDLADKLRVLTGCRVDETPYAQTVTCAPICTERIRSEFGFRPAGVLRELESVVACYREPGHPGDRWDRHGGQLTP
jgi:nucleoside-diphosphate-sugar epimerase